MRGRCVSGLRNSEANPCRSGGRVLHSAKLDTWIFNDLWFNSSAILKNNLVKVLSKEVSFEWSQQRIFSWLHIQLEQPHKAITHCQRFIIIFSKIQLVIYYQCCVLIGSASWAVDSEPIRARRIIVKNSPDLNDQLADFCKLVREYPASRGYIFAVWSTFRTPSHTAKM